MHRRTFAGALLPALMLVAVPRAHAQIAEAQPGTRVRITAPGIVAGRYVGTVLTRSPGVLQVGSPETQPIDIPVDRITSLELSRGPSRWAGVGRGAVWGGGIGAVLGVAFAAGDASNRTYFNYNTGKRDTVSRAATVAYWAFSSALTGGLIGALVPKERWERFELAPRTGVDRRRRWEVGVRVGF